MAKITQANDEFSAMMDEVGGTTDTQPEPEPEPEPQPEPGLEPEPPGIGHPGLPEEQDEAAEQAAAAEPDVSPEIEALKREIETLKQQHQQRLPTEPEAKPASPLDLTLGELASPYAPSPDERMLQPVAFLGIAEGETPESAYEAVMGVPPDGPQQVQALNALLNRVYRAAMIGFHRSFPALLEGGLQYYISRAEIDNEFWSKNRDLLPHREVVDALAERLRATSPGLTGAQYLHQLETLARKHLKMPRPVAKSGGRQHLAAGPNGGRHKPALAGGSGPRRPAQNEDATSIDAQIRAMQRAGG